MNPFDYYRIKQHGIDELWQLHVLSLEKRSVISKRGAFSRRPFPAAFIINLQGRIIYDLFEVGLYLYEPPPTIDVPS